MAEAVEIEFSEALARLQPLLGQEVCALVNVRDTFTGCAMEGELERVLTLPPDNCAVHIVIGDRQRIIIDPEDVEILLVSDSSEGRGWLEFHLPSGVVIRLEQV